VGLFEDLIKSVTVGARLLISLSGGIAGWWFTGYSLDHVHLSIFDDVLSLTWIAALFTGFTVAGTTHAANIMDGFNGLAAGTVLVCVSALLWLAYENNDTALMAACTIFIGALLGFLLLNWPVGALFTRRQRRLSRGQRAGLAGHHRQRAAHRCFHLGSAAGVRQPGARSALQCLAQALAPQALGFPRPLAPAQPGGAPLGEGTSGRHRRKGVQLDHRPGDGRHKRPASGMGIDMAQQRPCLGLRPAAQRLHLPHHLRAPDLLSMVY
jgi:hypothetical protein